MAERRDSSPKVAGSTPAPRSIHVGAFRHKKMCNCLYSRFNPGLPHPNQPTQQGYPMPKKLLFSVTKKDLVIEYFSGTGAGGQYRNKHQNCVRIHHPESGAIVTGQSSRERTSNLREAFNNLVTNTRFKVWHNKKIHEILSGKSIEEKVEEQLKPENLKIEVRNGKQWTEAHPIV